jgi:serine/threonine protein kinase
VNGKHRYRTLKVCVRGKENNHEIAVSDHLQNCSRDHPGKKLVRVVLDSFELTGPHENHNCLVYEPLGMSYTEFMRLLPDNSLPTDLLQRSIQLLLVALDYLHQCDVTHTGKRYIRIRHWHLSNTDLCVDISSNNILQGVEDISIFAQIEEDEIKRPIARKALPDRTLYYSRPMPVNTGLPVLCDLGEARVGNQKHRGDIMPGIYRAPEVISGMDWDSKVDIWSIGVMVRDFSQHPT